MKRTDFKDPFKGHCGYYHLSSHHLETQRIFRNDSDYIFGVNSLALLLSGSQVQVIAYCLMDNHLHLLLAGEYERCLGYYGKVLHRIAQYVKINYGVSGILRKEDVDIVAVLTGQQMKEEICYIHRNPYKARIDSPLAYRWSSADVYFNSSISTGVQVKTIPIKDRKVLFKTHIPVNDEYEHRDGKILNASFVAYKEASERFRDSVEYFDILRKYSLWRLKWKVSTELKNQLSFPTRSCRRRLRKYASTNSTQTLLEVWTGNPFSGLPVLSDCASEHVRNSFRDCLVSTRTFWIGYCKRQPETTTRLYSHMKPGTSCSCNVLI